MQAVRVIRPGRPPVVGEIDRPAPDSGEVLIEIEACGVCRTDLHLVDGEIPTPKLPVVPGHEIVGRVAGLGEGAERFALGDRVGVPWLAWTCGECEQCLAGRENLCPNAVFTGQGRDGGYAEQTTADERYCLPLPEGIEAAAAAPLLCAGLIGYRSLKFTEEARRLGLYGFGASAHIIAQVAVRQGRQVFAFTRPGDADAQGFARELGAEWSGGSDEQPPNALDAAILFAPVGELVPAALGAVRPGGAVVCAGIHMSEIPAMPYELLWGERVLRSVANLTRRDGEEFMGLMAREPVVTHVTTTPLATAPAALERLRNGEVRGAEVLIP
jgi:alcohol dehydrogenase, propanol-preferring